MKEKDREKEGGRSGARGVEEGSRRYGSSAYGDILGLREKIGLRCNEDSSGSAIVVFLRDRRF